MPPAAMSPEAFGWLIAAWLFALGAAVGSFLNVVIYRLPAGKSLVRPGSHCPACQSPIRWFDNVPILSWLVLRGRCRDCRARISPQYPIVEAITAGLFLLLGVVECLGGDTSPAAPTQGAFQLCGPYLCHLLLMCTLLAAVMIQAGGHRVPARLAAPAVLGGLCALVIWPGLHALPAWSTWSTCSDVRIAGLLNGAVGLAAGLALGWLAARLCGQQHRAGMILGPACVGLLLGWQAAALLTAAAVAIHLLLSLVPGRLLPGVRRVPPTAWLALAALAWILAWAWLARPAGTM
jgi:leader peptidase (prepilin peptidase)/N-methyltransferase